MAAGELTITDWTVDNVALTLFSLGQVVVADTANSTGGVVAGALPAGALAQPIGVCVDQSKPDPLNTAQAASGTAIRIRTWGIARVQVAGAVSAWDMVSVANTSGQVQTQARAGAGVQPVPVVGRALTAATAQGQSVWALLMIGCTY